jgi:hypothetical protein
VRISQSPEGEVEQSPVKINNRKCTDLKQYNFIFYDLECEQEYNGECLLVCFRIIIAGKPFFVPTIPTVLDGEFKCMYLSGSGCINKFRQIVMALLSSPSPARRYFLIAHNGMGYDHLYFIDGMKPTVLEKTDTKIIKCIFEKNGYELVLQDTYKFLNFPLSKFKDAWGRQKTGVDDFTIKGCMSHECIMYCARDVAVLEHLGMETIPNYFQAMQGVIYQHRYGLYNYYSQADCAYTMLMIDMQKSNKHYALQGQDYQVYKNCYFGAKVTSCLYGMKYDRPNHAYDLSSMYPAGANNPIPYGKMSKYHMDIDWQLYKCNPWTLPPFICRCILTKKHEPGYGIMPVHANETELGDGVKGIAYVTGGRIYGMYTCIDIAVAVLDGWKVEKYWDMLVYEGWTNACKTFYTKWFDIKQQSAKDPNKRWCAKIILNSSIGKCAQKAFMHDNAKPSHVGWFVLSYTRKQHLTMKQALQTKFLYGDTDSIWVDQSITFPDEWFQSHLLGNWDLITGESEGEFDCIYVLAKKMYLCLKDGKVVKKGHKGIKDLTVDMAEAMLRGESIPSSMFRPYKKITCKNGVVSTCMTIFHENVRHVKKVIPQLMYMHDGFLFNKALFI